MKAWLKRIVSRRPELRSLRTFDYWNNRSAAIATGGYTGPDAASGHAVAARCIALISENLAMVPCRLYRRDGDGGRAPADAHPLYDVLHHQFNDQMTAFDGREFLIASILVHGNAYARIERDGRGQVTALYPYAAPSVAVDRRPSGRILYSASNADGTVDRLLDGEMLHLRYRRSGDGLLGLSPIGLAQQTFRVAVAQQTQAVAQAENAFAPAGALVFPGQLRDEAMLKAKTYFTERVIGATRANEIIVLDAGAEWKPFTVSSRDAEFLESRKLSNLDVARIFGVPPTAAGIPDHATYSNVEQESTALVARCLSPMARRIEQQLMSDLLSRDARRELFVEHDLQGLLRGDQKARYESYNIGRQGGWLSPNEIRAWENMPLIDGGDEYLSPLNMAPVGGREQEATGA